jgi:hypothetical protein
MVTARWSLSLDDEHQERLASSTQRPILPSSPDGIIAACLSAPVLKAVADPFNTKLTDYGMRCDSRNLADTFAGMVGTQSCVAYKFTVAHFHSPYFLIYRVTGLKLS